MAEVWSPQTPTTVVCLCGSWHKLLCPTESGGRGSARNRWEGGGFCRPYSSVTVSCEAICSSCLSLPPFPFLVSLSPSLHFLPSSFCSPAFLSLSPPFSPHLCLSLSLSLSPSLFSHHLPFFPHLFFFYVPNFPLPYILLICPSIHPSLDLCMFIEHPLLFFFTPILPS